MGVGGKEEVAVLGARITPIPTFPRQGGRGKSGAVRELLLQEMWTSPARPRLWIPAYAGMTRRDGGNDEKGWRE